MNMHRILRHSVPGILRNAASRHRPLSSSFFPLNHNLSVTTKRRFSSSVLTTGNPTCVGVGGTERFGSTNALDKPRFLGVTDMKDAAAKQGISIQSDKENGTISFTDFRSIGMTGLELVDCFSKCLLKEDGKDDDSNFLFGDQLGVGFHSALLVSHRVEISTKCPKSGKQHVWEGPVNSASAASYTFREETDPAKLIPRGYRLTLHLKNDAAARKKVYSLLVEEEEETDEDKTKPIWLRNSKEVTTEEYNEFYKNTFNEHKEPLASSHFTTDEGFRSILYIPSIANEDDDGFMSPTTKNIRLYAKHVFISDGFDRDLFPQYLSFVKGVVDSNDLPCNASREILVKKSPTMRKRLVRKTLDMILGLSKDRRGDYEKFWDKFGKHLMLGCIEDPENHNRIAPLLRFSSSKDTKKRIGLDEYVENMKADQKDIYYIIASDSTTRNTPVLDIQVLFLVDSVDVVAVQALRSYKDKKFVKMCIQDFLDLVDKKKKEEKEKAEVEKQEFVETCEWMKKRLGGRVDCRVDRVEVFNLPNSSLPCVLSSGGNNGFWAAMEFLLEIPTVLKINLDHRMIKYLNAARKNNPNDDVALMCVDLLGSMAFMEAKLRKIDS